GTPSRWIQTAMKGAASTITTGNTIAAASSHTKARRGTVTSGEDNSTTGNSVTADIAHSETISTLSSAAASAGNTSGATNAISTRRRSGLCGHAVSPIAVRLGRVMTSAITAAGAQYAATPSKKPNPDNTEFASVDWCA